MNQNLPSILKKDHLVNVSPAGQLAAQLSAQLKGPAARLDRNIASAMIALESMNDGGRQILTTAVQNFNQCLATARSNLGMKGNLSLAQEAAAESSMVLASDIGTFLRSGQTTAENLRNASANMTGRGVYAKVVESAEPSSERVALEAYDERPNNNAMAYSASYNINSAKQNEFGEAFFPTVTLTPDQVGFSVNARLILTYNEVSRSAAGALANFQRRNIIRAIIDASMLQTDQTRLVPVYRSSGGNNSSANFHATIATTNVLVNNTSVPTRPLLVGKRFDLLGISQTDAILAAGQMDQTDAVDSSVRLSAVYVKLTATIESVAVTEYFKIDTMSLPTSDFQANPQGSGRLLSLRFENREILFKAGMLTTAGSASAILATMSTNTARVRISLTGEVTQDTGETLVSATPVSVTNVVDNTGLALDTGSGTGQTVAAIFSTMVIEGYDLFAYRTNSNRRNRGKLLDVQHATYLYTVPLLPPISALRPVASQDTEDGNLLSSLVTTTRIQTSNAAVTELLRAQSVLAAEGGVTVENAVSNPLMFGVASLLVVPAYISESLDVAAKIDSIKHSDRINDLKALLINKIRDIGAQLYANSGYGPALEAMYEGRPPKITLIVGTDPIIERYLNIDGDTRVTGDQFDYKIVASFDSRMAGKIVISFGLSEAFNSGVVTPLHFGNMAWKPELALMLPMTRGGSQSMELTVQPSFRHVTNLPIMGVLAVSNISSVVGSKVTIYMDAP